jgi:hypothetical protein
MSKRTPFGHPKRVRRLLITPEACHNCLRCVSPCCQACRRPVMTASAGFQQQHDAGPCRRQVS